MFFLDIVHKTSPNGEMSTENLFNLLNLNHHPYPVCVDLDHTLLQSSSLYFFFPKALPIILKTWCKGVFSWPHVKEAFSLRYPLDPRILPYRPFLLDFLRLCSQKKVPLTLVTGAHMSTAQRIQNHLLLFDTVQGSSRSCHLVAKKKAQWLCDTYGSGGFTYFGDSAQDIAVWDEAKFGVAVKVTPHLKEQINKRYPPGKIFFLDY